MFPPTVAPLGPRVCSRLSSPLVLPQRRFCLAVVLVLALALIEVVVKLIRLLCSGNTDQRAQSVPKETTSPPVSRCTGYVSTAV